jgi:ParB family chromosome partitioning protein
MSKRSLPDKVEMIPLDHIDVLNPRDRNGRVFEEIVSNIKTIGLKKPITVTPRKGRFLLICGEGRMKAFASLGETHIPALVITVNDEDAFIMSLAENIARRQCRPLEILANIGLLRDKGYSPKVIAKKTGLTMQYVQGILVLLQQGEERLLVAVEKGRIPLNAALTIVGAGDDDAAIQIALQEAYETGALRGKQLIQARRVIERRQSLGRSVARGTQRKRVDVTTSSLVRTYRKEVERQKQIVMKAEFAQQRLMFVVGALRELLAEENFINLLRAEGLGSLPKYLADRVWPAGCSL